METKTTEINQVLESCLNDKKMPTVLKAYLAGAIYTMSVVYDMQYGKMVKIGTSFKKHGLFFGLLNIGKDHLPSHAEKSLVANLVFEEHMKDKEEKEQFLSVIKEKDFSGQNRVYLDEFTKTIADDKALDWINDQIGDPQAWAELNVRYLCTSVISNLKNSTTPDDLKRAYGTRFIIELLTMIQIDNLKYSEFTKLGMIGPMISGVDRLENYIKDRVKHDIKTGLISIHKDFIESLCNDRLVYHIVNTIGGATPEKLDMLNTSHFYASYDNKDYMVDFGLDLLGDIL